MRQIKKLYQPVETSDGAGVKLHRIIANRQIDQVDPFLLLDHFGSENPDDYIGGFPMHPHRGIETVTYMLSGKVDHKDSIGNKGSVQAGDVQWMTAGKGIFHEEMPSHQEDKLNGFQLWVNMPAKLKMSAPRYQDIPAKSIPQFKKDGVKIKVIAGEYDGVKGVIEDIYTKPIFFDVSMDENSVLEVPVSNGLNVFAYLYEGEAEFDETTGNVSGSKLILFDEGDSIAVKTKESNSRFLLIAGEPLNEPVARYGPFVMNTSEEIQQTLAEIRAGTFAAE